MSQENNENVSLKQCPFCAEKINILAKKCRFCGEIIDPALMRISEMKQTDNSAMKINVISYPGMSVQVAPTVTASNVAAIAYHLKLTNRNSVCIFIYDAYFNQAPNANRKIGNDQPEGEQGDQQLSNRFAEISGVKIVYSQSSQKNT